MATGNFSTWFNLKASEIFCSTETVCNLRQIVITFKQEDDVPLVKAWERFRGIAFGMEHGLRDWMLMHIFYRGLSENSRIFLDNECEGSFMNTTAANTHILLDGLLLEVKIKESLDNLLQRGLHLATTALPRTRRRRMTAKSCCGPLRTHA